jgi:hypothetical protein
MLHNPYPSQVDNVDRDALRFQTYLSGEDKALLMSVRPIKGTAQVVINHLIKHICNDLRDLGITSYRPDADDIFTILVERRALTDDQIARLRRTTIGADQQVPTWLQQHRRGSGVRKRTANPASSTDHVAKQTTGRKQPTGRKTPTATEGR